MVSPAMQEHWPQTLVTRLRAHGLQLLVVVPGSKHQGISVLHQALHTEIDKDLKDPRNQFNSRYELLPGSTTFWSALQMAFSADGSDASARRFAKHLNPSSLKQEIGVSAAKRHNLRMLIAERLSARRCFLNVSFTGQSSHTARALDFEPCRQSLTKLQSLLQRRSNLNPLWSTEKPVKSAKRPKESCTRFCKRSGPTSQGSRAGPQGYAAYASAVVPSRTRFATLNAPGRKHHPSCFQTRFLGKHRKLLELDYTGADHGRNFRSQRENGNVSVYLKNFSTAFCRTLGEHSSPWNGFC